LEALVSLLLAVTLSLLIMRIAAEALILTGLSRQTAEFQAHSAITGSGFTTSESEDVVLLYGRLDAFSELDSRQAGSAGEQAHQDEIADHQQLLLERDRQDAAK